MANILLHEAGNFERRNQDLRSISPVEADQELGLQIEALSCACLDVSTALYKQDAKALRAATATLSEMAAGDCYARLQALASGGLPAATRVQIAQHLGVLMTCYQNARPSEVFVKIVIGDVDDMKPTLLALQQACRNLRRTCIFPPTIAEILRALREAEERLSLRLKFIREIPYQLDRASRELAVQAERQNRCPVPKPLRQPEHKSSATNAPGERSTLDRAIHRRFG